MGFFDFFTSKTPAYLLEKYYKNYPRKPYISPSRDCRKWDEMATTFPNTIIPPEMMKSYEDGLLPGHVRMLYWLKNVNRNKIPEYFEYEHGINFNSELLYLESEGYISGGAITQKGDAAIKRHADFLCKYYPNAKRKGAIDIQIETSGVMREIPEFLVHINEITTILCNKLKINPQIIDLHSLDYSKTKFKITPKTPKGNLPKYPRCIHYESKDNGKTWQFGDVWLLSDGKIGKTRQIYWKNKTGYFIYLGQTNGLLVPKKVERCDSSKNSRKLLYKEQKS